MIKKKLYILHVSTRKHIAQHSCLFELMRVFPVYVLQVWAWKENVWEKEKGTLLERYTVEQSKPAAEGGGVLSTLTINNVMESDFLSTYNCTAWNSFGPGTMIISLEEKGVCLFSHSGLARPVELGLAPTCIFSNFSIAALQP